MSKPFPSLTDKWHSKPYPAIDPSRPELSASGKVVVITGGGGSIGGATALAFAKAGASKIAVIGRNESTLAETKKNVENHVKNAQITVFKGDIVDAAAIKDTFSKIKNQLGNVDILVANAGYLPKFENILDADADEWWRGFEINGKGAFNTCRAFLPVAAEKALIVTISTGPVHMPAMPSMSGYIASKMAATKIYEFAHAENPNIEFVHLHPGVVASDINLKSGIQATDEADLPASFIVWAASPEAQSFRGKFLWCNWDVEELKARKEELAKPDELLVTLQGWPFGQSSDSGALTF